MILIIISSKITWRIKKHKMIRIIVKKNTIGFLIFMLLLMSSGGVSSSDIPEQYDAGKTIVKSQFLIDRSESGYAVHIVKGELDDSPGEDIGILWPTSLYIADSDGRVKSKIEFEWHEGIMDPRISIKKRGDFEIAVCSGSTYGALDKFGKPLWTYRQDLSANGMAFGDLDKDGRNEYCIAANELVCLDNNGQVIWKKADDYYSCVEFLISDAGSYIVTANHGSMVKFWDRDGKIIRQWQSKTKLLEIHFVIWMNQINILTFSPDSIILMDLNGEELLRYEILESPTAIYGIKGCQVAFAENYNCLSVLVKYASYTGKSMLFIFSPEKKIIYREMLRYSTGICNIKIPSHKEEVLLVGDGAGKVNRYSYFEQR